MNQRIMLRHGDGGLLTNNLIRDIFYKYFDNEILTGYQDSAIFQMKAGRLAFTTDSFVVKPIFFPGGDIGKLAVCGTVNDLTSAGAVPLYLSAGFVIEEGFEIEKLDLIASSMSSICKKAGVKIVAGDTKVVEKGSADGIYINTSGIGKVHKFFNPRKITSGDEIILTGTVGEHGTAILLKRYELGLKGDFTSDCNPLSEIVSVLGDGIKHVKLMRDPTRGGVANALCEISDSYNIGAIIEEEKLQIRPAVKSVHELLGTDPLYFACEGRMILVVEKGFGTKILNCINMLDDCQNSQIIGKFDDLYSKVCVRTWLGGERILAILENQMISRIC
ncbi:MULTISPECIES: hydrogenase expression/formation protein HypE [unclassified Sedimentibacter]|uniref:hydrogenase expression/formation protein HypE n=1 Tax=unclassified Sedimentibacter TaxID=2649220 RepID=UPI0027E06507|nr:hydrogenase expression/formation protein HypE [Sedimentibacter sp. MB35-C1]WMJ76850.1 hydrogenase expression/formation protein HypE [Sedimentibacter sp. MB35-C1]